MSVSDGAIFIIGAARSGTTILQNALNDAANVFLLGEPNLHLQGEEPGFAARYNAMHRNWRNQETKSTYLPELLDTDGPWRAHLAALSRHYPRLGAKVVVNASWTDDQYARFRAFQEREFFGARYLILFRDPVSTVNSTQHLQAYAGAEVTPVATLVANMMRVVVIFTRSVRTLPHVRALFHDELHRADWAALGAWLGADCSGAAAYYDPPRPSPYAMDELTARDRKLLELAVEIIADLRAAAAPPVVRPQVEQNENQLSEAHFTPLGFVHRRALMVMAEAGYHG